MDTYTVPANLQEACEILGTGLATGPATIAAGCTDLFPATRRTHLTGPVVDISRLPDLRGITADERGIRIGAATTWSEIARADLPAAFDMLKQAAREVGGIQIQNAGTLGGNLCNASPAADGVPPLLALNAAVELASLRGTRSLPLADFLTGPRQTARSADEILTAIHLPAPSLTGQSRFLKLGARRHLVISIVMVAARIDVTGDRIDRAAIAVGACSPVATRLPDLEGALTGCPVGEAPGRVQADLIAPALAPLDDIRADAGYRGEAAVTLIRRAVGNLTQPGTEAAA